MQTAYERAFDSPYQGRIGQFGEVVLAYVKSIKKGAPRWLKGVWLTKTLNHDAHVIALPSAIVCTRSVRRLCNQWDLERCGSLEQSQWEFGLATLGSKLVSAKRIIELETLTCPLGDAIAGGESAPLDEAASDPPSPDEIADKTTLDELAKDAPQAGLAAQAGQETEEITQVVEDVEETVGGMPNPSLVAMEIDHEDEPNLTQFLDEELDYVEDYDYNIEDEQVTEENFEGDLESMLDRLSRPYSKEEPTMEFEELQELDALADLVEITRLRQQES